MLFIQPYGTKPVSAIPKAGMTLEPVGRFVVDEQHLLLIARDFRFHLVRKVVCVTFQRIWVSVSVQSKKVRLPVQNLLKLNS